MGFGVEIRQAPPGDLLADSVAITRRIVVCRPTQGALVLGSTQPETAVDSGRCAAAGLEVWKRRSGGGAVVVRPGAQIWVDVSIPRGDPLFVDDVLDSFVFVGEAWCRALAETLPVRPGSLAVVDPREAARSKWSRSICFAGTGPGEVTLGGRKAVGISQRRDRSGATFHSMAMLELDAREIPALLRLGDVERLEAETWLASTATALPGRDLQDALTSALVDELSEGASLRSRG